MELQITKEKVLEAAAKCNTAKETLKTLFPEVFEDDKYIDLSPKREPREFFEFKGIWMEVFRSSSNYLNNKCLFISGGGYNWELKEFDSDSYLLIPTKK